MCFFGLPNRRTLIPLNTYGISWINVCASDNLHLRPSIRPSVLQQQWRTIQRNNVRKLTESMQMRCRAVLAARADHTNLTGSVLKYDKLTFFTYPLKYRLLIFQ